MVAMRMITPQTSSRAHSVARGYEGQRAHLVASLMVSDGLCELGRGESSAASVHFSNALALLYPWGSGPIPRTSAEPERSPLLSYDGPTSRQGARRLLKSATDELDRVTREALLPALRPLPRSES